MLYLLPDLEVYYNPHYIASLLSMSVVTSKYCVTTDTKSSHTWKITKKLNSLITDMEYINFISPMISHWGRIQIISPTTKQLINLKSLSLATNLYPLFPPIEVILTNAKLKEWIMHNYCREG